MKTCAVFLLAIGLVDAHADCETDGDCQREPAGNTWLQARTERNMGDNDDASTDDDDAEGEVSDADKALTAVKYLIEEGETDANIADIVHDNVGIPKADVLDIIKQVKKDRLMESDIAAEEEKADEKAEWGFLLPRRRRSDVAEWASCHPMAPGKMKKASGVDLRRCQGFSHCEFRGKIEGSIWEMEGRIRFECPECYCTPDSGRLTFGRKFSPYPKQAKKFGCCWEEMVEIKAIISVSLDMGRDGADGILKVAITLSGGMSATVGVLSGDATLWGTIEVGGINLNDGENSAITLRAYCGVTFGVEVFSARWELKLKLADTGAWELPNPTKCNNACQVIVKAADKYVAQPIKKKAEKEWNDTGGKVINEVRKFR